MAIALVSRTDRPRKPESGGPGGDDARFAGGAATEHNVVDAYRAIFHDEIMHDLSYWTMLYEERKPFYPPAMTRIQVLALTAFIQVMPMTGLDEAGGADSGLTVRLARRCMGAHFPRETDMGACISSFRQAQARIYDHELDAALGKSPRAGTPEGDDSPSP